MTLGRAGADGRPALPEGPAWLDLQREFQQFRLVVGHLTEETNYSLAKD